MVCVTVKLVGSERHAIHVMSASTGQTVMNALRVCKGPAVKACRVMDLVNAMMAGPALFVMTVTLAVLVPNVLLVLSVDMVTATKDTPALVSVSVTLVGLETLVKNVQLDTLGAIALVNV